MQNVCTDVQTYRRTELQTNMDVPTLRLEKSRDQAKTNNKAVHASIGGVCRQSPNLEPSK